MEAANCVHCGNNKWLEISSEKSRLGPETMDKYICQNCNPQGQEQHGKMSWAYRDVTQKLPA